MKILITGNMGYVGPSVINQLRAAYPDATLIGLDMGYFAHCLTGSDVLPECRVDIQYFADVRKLPLRLLQGTDAVVHLAAISNDPMGNAFESVTFEINYLSSVELARKAKQAGVKSFVFASSCSVYGLADSGARNESSEVNPLTAYAKSKINTERELEKLAGPDFMVTSLRFATAAGMSERLRLDLVLNDFVASAVVAKKITILSDGTPWRPLIHIKDMARAVDWAVARAPSQGGEFLAVNAGSNEWNYQVAALAEAVAKLVPGVDIATNKDAPPDKRSYRVDFSLFRRLAPNHQPQVDLNMAVSNLKQGLEAMNFSDPGFRNSSYMRLKVLSALRDKGLLNERLEWVQARAARQAA